MKVQHRSSIIHDPTKKAFINYIIDIVSLQQMSIKQSEKNIVLRKNDAKKRNIITDKKSF